MLMYTRKYSYCKGKDCKKHTLHKVTQCESRYIYTRRNEKSHDEMLMVSAT